MRSHREALRHTQSLLAAAALVLPLGATGCCWFQKNLVNTGEGVDVYGSFQFAGDVQPTGELVVAVVGECGAKEHCYDVNTVAKDAVDHGWHYAVIVPPGEFDLLVFSDQDGDGQINRADLVGRAKVKVPESADPAGMMEGPTLAVDLAHPTDAGFHVALKEQHVQTLYPALQDRFFAKKWGPRGLMWPVWGLRHTDNEFLFGLGTETEPDAPAAQKGKDKSARRGRLARKLAKRVNKAKVQVLFVHGVQDTPVSWATLSALDPARYQPWFFFYPTGLPLTQLGEELAMVIESLAANAETVLVAHSMGGLVSRQALKVLAEAAPAKFPLKGYLSLGTPYGGMPSANGMNNIPMELRPYVTRQSLFDVQPKSAFLSSLYQDPYPDALPFYLFYGTAHGDGDGTVPLPSAIDPRAFVRATDACAFDLSHVGLLANGREPAAAALKTAFQAALENIVRGAPDKVCPPQAAMRP